MRHDVVPVECECVRSLSNLCVANDYALFISDSGLFLSHQTDKRSIHMIDTHVHVFCL